MTDKPVISNPEEFSALFNGKKEAALREAIKARKEETDLYWRRSTYFWTLSAVALTGYFTLQNSDNVNSLSLFTVSCIGFLFSFTWLLANKGAKQWIINWEHHVFLLEDEVIGPLFKTIAGESKESCSESNGWGKNPLLWLCKIPCCNLCIRYILEPEPYSVIKLNQILCSFLSIIWLFLAMQSLLAGLSSLFECFIFSLIINVIFLIFMVSVTLMFAGFMFTEGRSNTDTSKEFSMKLLKYNDAQKKADQ